MSGVQQPVYAIIPAGGTGQRFTSSIPKQYTQLNGQPLILYTLRVLNRISWIERIYLAIADDWVKFLQGIIDRHKLNKVELVKGGPTRHASIRNCVNIVTTSLGLGGKNGVPKHEPIVILHDAVRPFVKEETYRDVVQAAAEYQASGCVCGLVSTVLSVTEDGFLERALKRSEQRASNTPQAFTYDVIKRAYENISDLDLAEGTECLDLALKYCGVKAKLVPAPDEVQKVTHRKDIFAAEALAREQSISAVVVSLAEAPLISGEICRKLQSKRLKVEQTGSIDDISHDIQAVVLIVDQVGDTSKSFGHLSSIQKAYASLRNGDIQATLTVLYLCCQEVPEAGYSQLRQFNRGIRRDLQEDDDTSACIVHMVIWEHYLEEDKSSGAATVAELVASLVFDRNPTMNGQIFTLP